MSFFSWQRQTKSCSYKELNKKKTHLGYQLIRSLKKNFFGVGLIDYGLPKPIRLKRGTLLVLALELAEEFKAQIPAKRVGVVLPPGVGGVLVNIGLILAGKIPVNLNFTIGRENVSFSMNKAEVSTLISAEAMKNKITDFPWTSDFFDIGNWLSKKRKQKWRLVWLHFRSLICSPSVIFRGLDIQCDPNEEAALLFTSGSSGNPKGVVLSHDNLLSNCRQIQSVQLFASQSHLLANLPLFHSFGFTISMLYTMLTDLVMVCLPSPLDVKSSLEVIEKEKVEVLLGTPTFLRGYLRKARKEQLQSLRFVVAGAEKTPPGFKEEWESVCPCDYLEGYGLTELSPAVSFNLPGLGTREKSVGKLLPEIKCKTISTETSEELPAGEVGILCLNGPNLFSGYLDNPEANQAAFDHQGWYITGDLARIDSDGFLFIEGRLSRFSKIGGEMVPHARVEEEITKAFFPEKSQSLKCAVVGLPDESKGEKLILLSTDEIQNRELRERLLGVGIPNLWIPKEIKLVDEIPMLASGKLDLKRMRDISLG